MKIVYILSGIHEDDSEFVVGVYSSPELVEVAKTNTELNHDRNYSHSMMAPILRFNIRTIELDNLPSVI
jgi:hypothetical protein